MFSFVPIKYDNRCWVITAVKWSGSDKPDCYLDFNDYIFKLDINANDLKTELIRKWNGKVGYKTVEFETREDADKAIGYIESLQTEALLNPKKKN